MARTTDRFSVSLPTHLVEWIDGQVAGKPTGSSTRSHEIVIALVQRQISMMPKYKRAELERALEKSRPQQLTLGEIGDKEPDHEVKPAGEEPAA